MTTEEFGAYVKILIAMWRNGAWLPAKQGELALIAGVTPERWREMEEKVLRPMDTDGAKLTQRKLTLAWQKILSLQAQRIAAGKARWKRS